MKLKLILIYTAWLGLASCDLETSPTTSVASNNVFNRTQDSEMVLEGVWRYLMDSNSGDRNPSFATIQLTDDVMGSDVAERNSPYGTNTRYDFTDIYGKANSVGSLIWTLLYAGINNANNVIDNIDNAIGTQDDRNRIKGQAYALRGYMYLVLASHYSFSIDTDPSAVCAPIYTHTTDFSTAVSGEPASSVSEVYAQSISDLEEALQLIPENYVRSAKYKINRQVVLGLLSRASLYARQWQKAADYSRTLLAENSYLMDEEEWKSGFNSINNGEWIWGHPQSSDQNGASQLLNYLDTTDESASYFSMMVDPYLYELYDESDYRRDQIYWSPFPGVSGDDATVLWMRNEKFRYADANAKYGDGVLMRVGEIYLINAEANARLGKQAAAVQSLNTLRSARRAVAAAASLKDDELIEAIWTERRKELWGEGFALVDIIRNRQAVERKDWTGAPYPYRYVDATGTVKTREIVTAGHRILKFPDGSDFTPNSKYYLYRIPDSEETSNIHLYEKYPKLAIYE